jgi:D-aspartate ligase
MEELNKQDIIPVLLGVDINAYGVARSFYEKYGIKSLVLGEKTFFHTENTKILYTMHIDNLQDEQVLFSTLMEIGKKYSDKKLFLLPTAEVYVEPVVNNKKELSTYFIIPSIDSDLLYDLVRKDKFYDLCAKHNIAIPETIVLSKNDYQTLNYDFDFGYPMVIKPNNSRTYFRTKFIGKKKAYIAKNMEDAKRIIHLIYENSSYSDELILQEFIPGEDEHMSVLSSYSDKNAKTKHITFTHVLLEDHSPQLIGNPVAHIVELQKDLSDSFVTLLDELKYIGFSNIDLKYDVRDAKYKALDFNARLGRSSYHITASGYNIGKFLIDDYIDNKEITLSYNDNSYLWSAVPLDIIFKYVSNSYLKNKAKELIKNKKYSRSLFYDKDMNIIRRLKLFRMDLAYYKNFKENMQ